MGRRRRMSRRGEDDFFGDGREAVRGITGAAWSRTSVPVGAEHVTRKKGEERRRDKCRWTGRMCAAQRSVSGKEIRERDRQDNVVEIEGSEAKREKKGGGHAEIEFWQACLRGPLRSALRGCAPRRRAQSGTERRSGGGKRGGRRRREDNGDGDGKERRRQDRVVGGGCDDGVVKVEWGEEVVGRETRETEVAWTGSSLGGNNGRATAQWWWQRPGAGLAQDGPGVQDLTSPNVEASPVDGSPPQRAAVDLAPRNSPRGRSFGGQRR